jgi:hypothetical protein
MEDPPGTTNGTVTTGGSSSPPCEDDLECPDDLGADVWALRAAASPGGHASGWALGAAASPGDRGEPMNIVYPSGAFVASGGPVIDITRPPYNAKGDGVTDDTAAFRRVLTDLRDSMANRRAKGQPSDPERIIYVRTGTYVVSDTIIHDGSIAQGFSYLRLIGQDRRNTVIRLRDASPGFGYGASKPLVTFTKVGEHQGNVMWGNQIRNLTLDTGSGNPGAVGLVFLGANGSSMDNITIRSGDGQGSVGLSFPTWSVQGHYADISVTGFDYGIRLQSVTESNAVLEYVTVRNQRVAGVLVDRSHPSIRRLHSVNLVPAITIEGIGAHVVLVDAALTGGANANTAITMARSPESQLFVRDTTVQGYGGSISVGNQVRARGNVDEFVSGQPFRFDMNSPTRTLRLPVEEMRLVPWESNPANWASPEDYAGSTPQRIQAALDSGKPAIYFPRTYDVADFDVVFHVPASVRQLDFMHRPHRFWATFAIDRASSTDLWVENLSGAPRFRVDAARDVRFRFASARFRVNTGAPVSIFFESASPVLAPDAARFCPPNVRIYARSINEESRERPNFPVNGGRMWVLGFKTEAHQPAFSVSGGGLLEVLGGYQNMAATSDAGNPVLINNNSHVSYVATNFMTRFYNQAIWETRGSTTRQSTCASFPERITANSPRATCPRNYFVPLYTGYDPARRPQRGPSGTADREWWTGLPGTRIGDLTAASGFPNSPSGTDKLYALEATSWADPRVTRSFAEQYGQRIRAYLLAPATGQYRFWIAGDNASELWLSTDDRAANRRRIAHVASWTRPYEWGKAQAQRSALIDLIGGRAYYVEVLQKEDQGGDHVAVAWSRPGQSDQSPAEIVPGSVLSSYRDGVPTAW